MSLLINRPLEENVVFAWLEVAVKRGDDVGALIAVNLSLGFLSIFPVPRLQTDTCNDPSHGDKAWML